jgi:hypothetical protein
MSNTPVTEIVTLTSNDAMKTTSNFQEVIALMRHSTFDGLQRMHWGDRVQQPGIRQWFISEILTLGDFVYGLNTRYDRLGPSPSEVRVDGRNIGANQRKAQRDCRLPADAQARRFQSIPTYQMLCRTVHRSHHQYCKA